ncbi:MAG: efflux RND transporter periplasmic adaptor subunit [Pseudomonadota bacterium]
MDTLIEPRHRHLKLALGIGAAVVVLIGLSVAASRLALNEQRALRVSTGEVDIATAIAGEFRDVIPFAGQLVPERTVYIDAVEGGRVDEVFVEAGELLRQGDPILRLSNSQLQLDVIGREAEISEQVNNLRNTNLSYEERKLQLENDRIEFSYQVKRLSRVFDRQQELRQSGVIATEELRDTEDELTYYQDKLRVTEQFQVQSEKMRSEQVRQLQATIERLERNYEIAQANLDHLLVRAPQSGLLSALNVDLGERKDLGERLGQIDATDAFKISVSLDEVYLPRLRRGLMAEVEFGDQVVQAQVGRIFPEVVTGRFDIELYFADEALKSQRGRSVRGRIHLGEGAQGLLLPVGPYLERTGGAWVFVVDPGGATASKRSVQLGRRNSTVVEVLSGVARGERVVTSSYDAYDSINVLKLTASGGAS